MPRNGSGTYTLPSGNPVAAGTLIDATWANNTLNDIANELTDSLSRSGEGGMLAPFRIADGLQATPGLAFTNEPSTGFYRAGSNDAWLVVGGTQVTQLTTNGMAGRFAAGAVTTPSITRLGDLNTGIYFPGADEFAIATGGVLRLSIDAAGAVAIPGTLSVTGNVTFDTNTLFVDAAANRVGVGTVTPAVKLDVAGGISIGSADNLTWGGAYGATTPAIAGSAGFLAFYPNGSTSGEQMRLNATGLGIGTASAASKLHVSNTAAATRITITDDVAAGRSGYIESNYSDALVIGTTSGVRGIRFSPDNTPRMYLDTSGNLGIGTSNPTGKLTISNAGAAGIEFFPTGGIGGGAYYNAYNRSTLAYIQFTNYASAHTWYVSTAGNSRAMDLDTSGNLGLGVTPSAWSSGFKALQIAGQGVGLSCSTSASELYLSSNGFYDGSNWKYINSSVSGQYRIIGNSHQWHTAASGTAGNAITFTQAMTLDASGNLGVGTTSPGERLDVRNGGLSVGNGTIKTVVSYTTEGLIGTTSNHALLLYANNAERARITAAGELMVGTTGPNAGERLHVKGAGNTSSTYNCYFENSGGSRVFSFEDAGKFNTGTLADSPYNYVVGATNRDLFVDNAGAIGYVSSVRASKTNIAPVSDTDWLLQLNPVTFNFRKKDADGNYTDEADGPVKHGLIAEEVEAVNSDLCFYDDEDKGGALRGVNYSHLITPMLKLIQKQQAAIAALEAKVAALEAAP